MARVLYLFLHSTCCDMLFWLNYVKKSWPPTDLLLGKGEIFNSLLRYVWVFFSDAKPNNQWYFLKC